MSSLRESKEWEEIAEAGALGNAKSQQQMEKSDSWRSPKLAEFFLDMGWSEIGSVQGEKFYHNYATTNRKQPQHLVTYGEKQKQKADTAERRLATLWDRRQGERRQRTARV